MLSLLLVVPAFAQKLSKEEKAALAKAANSAAIEAVNARTFVIVPSSYTDSEGMIVDNVDNSNFFSSEGKNCFAQGVICCDNTYNNITEATEYDVNIDKKGNLKLRIVVSGRMLKGTYTISMRNNGNNADVIFMPQSGTTRKFSGPIVPLAGASYNKRANPI